MSNIQTVDREVPAPVKKNQLATSQDSQNIEALLKARKIDAQYFSVLRNVVWPTAKKAETVLMAVDYCKARKLDPMKKPVHIVPMFVGGVETEGIWTGIGELRITAARTGQYAGCEAPEYGPMIEEGWTYTRNHKKTGVKETVAVKVKYPEWVKFTVYKIVAGLKCSFVSLRYWKEIYATANPWTEAPNGRWQDAPREQAAKCTEADALRKAFPEECGEMTAEEMDGRVLQQEGDDVVIRNATGGEINRLVNKKAEELAAKNAAALDVDVQTVDAETIEDGDDIPPPPGVQPTLEEKAEARVQHAKDMGADQETIDTLEKSAQNARGRTSREIVGLMKLATGKGWKNSQILDVFSGEPYNLSRKKYQEEMTERQYMSLKDFFENNNPPAEDEQAEG